MIVQRLRPRPTVEHVGAVTTVTFSVGKVVGEDNFIARELLGITEGLGRRHLYLNLCNVVSLVSAELGTLVFLSEKRKAGGGRLTLINVNPRAGEYFNRTNLNGSGHSQRRTGALRQGDGLVIAHDLDDDFWAVNPTGFGGQFSKQNSGPKPRRDAICCTFRNSLTVLERLEQKRLAQ